MHTARLLGTLALAGIGAAAFAQPADLLPSIPRGDIAVNLRTIATGLGAPDYAISAPGSNRLFVVEQAGTLRVIENGSLLAAPALDISARIGLGIANGPTVSLIPTNANDERGFLGLAFHPGFADAASAGFRTLYTYSSESLSTGAPTFAAPNNAVQNYRLVVNEYKMSAANPALVDASTRREVVSFGKNANNHNGGTITFGHDGYLYLGLGDGGNANDVGPSHLEPGGNSQNLSTPLGKMLRIDPLNPALTAASGNLLSANGLYRIPTANPFVGQGGALAEVYALGFRNPYRFSVDRLNGQIIVADVGQNNVEEINRLQAGGNYGWAVKEGTFLFYRADPDGAGPLARGSVGANSPGSPAGLIDPISGTLGTLQYDHQDGISITGGFVYRGDDIPALYGKYVFGDLALTRLQDGPRIDGRLFYADLDTGEIKEFQLPQFSNGKLPDRLTVHGFGEDASGELYALVTNTSAAGTGGIVFQITAVPEPGTWAMFVAGLALLPLARRRLRGRTSPA